MDTQRFPAKKGTTRWLQKLLVLLVAIVSVCFLATKAYPKFIFTESSYGDYYWFRGPWLLIHTVAGTIALLSGPVQFLKKFRTRHLQLHRYMGRVYLIAVIVSGVCSVYLSLTSAITYIFTAELFIGSVAWLATCVPAYTSIKKGNIKVHREWMTRNYVLTFFFIIFFGFFDLFKYLHIGSFEFLASVLPLSSLVVPLAITEYYLRRKKSRLKTKPNNN